MRFLSRGSTYSNDGAGRLLPKRDVSCNRPEADLLVQLLRVARVEACDDGSGRARGPQAVERTQAGRSREATTLMIRMRSDGLEQANGIVGIEPREAERRKACVRCFDHVVEVRPVRPLPHQTAVALRNDTGRRPD